MATKKKLTLNVLFDTSVIFTGSASDLFRKEVVDLFENHSAVSDIDVVWYIPEIVLKERIFQMNKKGNELLPSIQKLEKLLGHNLGINHEIVKLRIDESIKKQIEKYNVKIAKTDTTKVDWDNLINNAAFRKPPFEDSEKEKGFRDALILEALKQIITNSPTTKSICRIIFFSNDGLLHNAAKALEETIKNLNVFSNIEELISLINILTSQITEELIDSIRDEAGKIFFVKNDMSTLYFTEGIRKKISEDFAKELSSKPEGIDERENGTWWVNKPGFEKKDKQRVFWKSIIEVDYEYFKTTLKTNPSKSLADILQSKESNNPFFTTAPLFSTDKEKISDGKTRFEVLWSVTLTTNKKLKNPKIESLNYIDNIPK